MERLVKGDIVVLPFPFSDLSSARKRPALVLAGLTGDDLILCQITSSKAREDKYAVHLLNKHIIKGTLKVDSLIRPNRLFTADKSLISYTLGKVSEEKLNEAIEKACEILRG